MTLEDSIEMIEAQGEAMKHFSAFLQAVEDLGAMRFLSKLIAEFRQRLDDYGPSGYLEWGAIEFGAIASLNREDDEELSKAAGGLGAELHSLLSDHRRKLTVEDLRWMRTLLKHVLDGYKADETAEQSTRAYLATPSAEEKPAQSTPMFITQSELRTAKRVQTMHRENMAEYAAKLKAGAAVEPGPLGLSAKVMVSDEA